MGDFLQKIDPATENRYFELKNVVRKSVDDLGSALKEIRDRKLYKVEYNSFENFLSSEIHVSRKHGYRLIDASNVIQNVSQGTQYDPPETERVARELSGLTRDEQIDVWNKANESLNGGKVTAKDVAEVIQKEKRIGPDENITPAAIYGISWMSLQGVDMDPCSDLDLSLNATYHLSKEHDGLAADWIGKCFVHPPKSKIGDFVAKAVHELEVENIEACILYLPAEHWHDWHPLVREYPRLYLNTIDPLYRSGRMLVLLFKDNRYFLNFEAETKEFGEIYIYNG